MKLSRRAFLGSILGAAAVSGCSRVIDDLAQPDLPDQLILPGGTERHPIAHLLHRAAYGPRPGQVEEVERMGRDRWLERQLKYRDIDDNALDWRLRRYDTLNMIPRDIMSFTGDRDEVTMELAQATLVRAIFSERQLYEVMVGFWSNHFSIYHFKDNVTLLKTIDDREVIRRHALGRFGNMLRASAHSPAMLLYLDNTVNEKSHPNENYAREIMELHTLGVDGGYDERDIQEVARCFTGWTITERGEFTFNEDWHDDGAKVVLGHRIPSGGGKDDADRVLDILIAHPSTAQFVCTKLVRHFVADDPPPEMVATCVQTWSETEGDIKAILRTLFNHPEFDNAPFKFKRPFELLVSMLRASNANYNGDTGLIDRLERMGHRPFAWVTPDGYPDNATIWANGILRHWQLADDALHNRLPGVGVDVWDIAEHVEIRNDFNDMLQFYARLFLKRDLTAPEQAIFQTFYSDGGQYSRDLGRDANHDRMTETLVLMLQHEAFQWR